MKNGGIWEWIWASERSEGNADLLYITNTKHTYMVPFKDLSIHVTPIWVSGKCQDFLNFLLGLPTAPAPFLDTMTSSLSGSS